MRALTGQMAAHGISIDLPPKPTAEGEPATPVWATTPDRTARAKPGLPVRN
jgi:hypothetical protein